MFFKSRTVCFKVKFQTGALVKTYELTVPRDMRLEEVHALMALVGMIDDPNGRSRNDPNA
jgi:hypothetical protein